MEEEQEGLDPKEIQEMEEHRIHEMNEHGIDERAVIGKAREHFNIWGSYFNENIVRGKDDLNFTMRDQWTAIERSEFTRLFKPAMTNNLLKGQVRKVLGQQRKNKPDLLVRSLTGRASQEQINLRADLVRTISYQSQNDLVYQTAFRSALTMGFGAFQIGLDYEHAKSFNQCIRYKTITDATRCSFDPTAEKPHKGDGNFCARNYTFSQQEFDAMYPYVTNPVSYIDQTTLLDFQWQTKDTIVVCDYYMKEWFPFIAYKLSDGSFVSQEQWEDMQSSIKLKMQLASDSSEEMKRLILSTIPTIKHERQSQDYRIMHYRMTQSQIIDFATWPSKQLPIIFVDGDSCWIEGRQYTSSFIHEARDTQKAINFILSETMAEIKNRRREQWLGTPDNIIGYEQDWRNPETQMGILRAKPDPKTGQMPAKQAPWELSQTLLAQAQKLNTDLNINLGMTEAPDMTSRDISGIAKRQRRMDGADATFIFSDNFNQAIEQGGRVVLDLLPVIYGEDERAVIVTGKDGKTKDLVLNQQMPDGSVKNELSPGEYDIEIDTGPSFAVQKEIALEFMQTTLAANPQAFNLIADLWAKNLDVQFMPQMAERFESLVPPQILAKEQGKPAPPPQPDPQMQMMQQEMQMKQQDLQLKQGAQKLQQQKLMLDAKKMMQDVQDSQSYDDLEKAKLMVDIKKTMANIESSHLDRAVDLHKANLDHIADIHKTNTGHITNVSKMAVDHHSKRSGISADIFKHNNPQQSETNSEE